MAKETDQKTLDLIKEVSKRKAEISRLEKPNWITNCSFSYVDGNLNNAVNIHVLADVKELISMAGFLMDKERVYGDACVKLDLDGAPTFTWNGYKIKEWLEDIKTRINKIGIATKRKSLEKLETRLSAIISPELRAQMELDEIENEMKKG